MLRPRSTRNRVNRTFTRYFERVKYYHKETDTMHECDLLWFEFQQRPAPPGVEIEVLERSATKVLMSMDYETFLKYATPILEEEI